MWPAIDRWVSRFNELIPLLELKSNLLASSIKIFVLVLFSPMNFISYITILRLCGIPKVSSLTSKCLMLIFVPPSHPIFRCWCGSRLIWPKRVLKIAWIQRVSRGIVGHETELRLRPRPHLRPLLWEGKISFIIKITFVAMRIPNVLSFRLFLLVCVCRSPLSLSPSPSSIPSVVSFLADVCPKSWRESSWTSPVPYVMSFGPLASLYHPPF